MITLPARETKVRSEAGQARVYIAELGDMKRANGMEGMLPPLCNMLRQRSVQPRCDNCADTIERIVGALPGAYPFPVCCWGGLKNIVVPAEGGRICVVFARGPFAHARHLREVHQRSGIPYDTIRALWFALPQFGRLFSKTILRRLKEGHVPLSSTVRKRVLRLGRAYAHYSEDMIEFDSLRRATKNLLQSSESRSVGVILQCLSVPRRIPVVRIVYDRCERAGGPSGHDSLAIIGFAFENKEIATHTPFWDHPVVKQVTQVLCDNTGVEWEEGYHAPDMHMNILLGLQKNKTYEKDAIEGLKKLILIAVAVGQGTYSQQLSAKLCDGLEGFAEELAEYLVCFEGTFGKEQAENLHQRVLSDVRSVLDKIQAEELPLQESFCSLVREILAFLSRYPTLMPATQGTNERLQEFAAERRACLWDDILKGGRKYLSGLKKEVILIEGGIRQVKASETRKVALAILADSIGVITECLSLGTVYAHDVSGYIRARAYHRYAKEYLTAGHR